MWITFVNAQGIEQTIGVPEGAIEMHLANLRAQGLRVVRMGVQPPGGWR